MSLRVSTWNINSVRLREKLVLNFLERYQPDILALQETKCLDHQLPRENFIRLGYEHVAYNGQKTYNGVLILSKIKFCNFNIRCFCKRDDARHISIKFSETSDTETLRGLEFHNFYVPAGGNTPDPIANDKFAYKLSFINEMRKLFSENYDKKTAKLIVVGDLNIAPYENDVWSHKQMKNTVSHTAIEIDKLLNLKADLNFTDVLRRQVSLDKKLYSWWSYRALDWKLSDRGRRLDHIWVSPVLSECFDSGKIISAARDWERPSDHVPVIADFDL